MNTNSPQRPLAVLALLSLFQVLGSSSALADDPPARPRKVLIYSLSGGTTGHLGIAGAIEKAILKEDPTAQIETVDVFQYDSWFDRKIFSPLFWKLTAKAPGYIDKATAKFFDARSFAQSLLHPKQAWSYDTFAKKVREVKPDVILSTMYQPALYMSALREMGELRDIPVGYVQSEALEGFFPRIVAGNVKTFLADPAERSTFVARGAPDEKLVDSGVPLDASVYQPLAAGEREAYLASLGMDKDVPTIAMAAGGGGQGDLPSAVEQIVRSRGKRPLQLIVMAGQNPNNLRRLEAIRKKLPPHIKLKAYGYTKEYWKALKAADFYVGKAGGIAATALFQLGKPSIFLNFLGGFERELNRHFQRRGLAWTNEDPKKLGEQVNDLLDSPRSQQRMLARQAAFRASTDPKLSAIVDFARNARPSFKPISNRVGRPGGDPIRGHSEALQALEQRAPAQVELLLAYPRGPESPKSMLFDSLVAARLMVRVGNEVFLREGDSWTVQPWDGLLYGTSGEGELGRHFGLAYANETLGLRLRGLTAEQLRDVRALLERGQRPEEVIRALGLSATTDVAPLAFRVAVTSYRENARIQGNLVSYDPVVTNAAIKKLAREPSLDQRRQQHLEQYEALDRLQTYVDKRLRVEAGNPRLVFDDHTHRYGYPPPLEIPAELTEAEARLRQQSATLRERRQAPEQVLLELEARRRGFSAAEWDKVVAGDLESLGEKREEAVALRQRVAEAAAAWNAFNAEYDGYQRAKLPFILDRLVVAMEGQVAELGHRVGTTERLHWEEALSRLRGHRNAYEAREHLYGQGKDFRRVQAFTDFTNEAAALAKRIRKSFAPAPRNRAESPIRKWSALGKMIVPAAKVLWRTLADPASPKLSAAIREASLPVGELLGLQVDVHHRGRLPAASTNPKVITLYTSSHGTGSIEVAGVNEAGLDFSKMSIFAAPTVVGPRFLGEVMEKNPGFIVVGRSGGAPIARMDELLAGGQREFLVLPDGYTSAGVYDVGPVREKWSTELVEGLIAKGWEPRIVNLNMPSNLTLGNDVLLPDSNRRMQVDIDPVADFAALRLVRAVGGDPRAVGNMVRASWLDCSTQYRGKVVGGEPVAELLPRLVRRITGESRICGRFADLVTEKTE